MFDQALPSAAGSPPNVTLNVTQMRLIHHYTTVTAKTLAHNPDSERVFATNVIPISFSYPSLLHAVLALAALHISRIEGPSSPTYAAYRLLADKHHDAALGDFPASVRDIDSTNWKAVLMFAGALYPLSCTIAIRASENSELAFANFLSNFALTRRVRPMMKQSELGLLMPDDIKGVNWATMEAPADTELVQSRKFSEVVHHLYPPDIVDAYGHAINILELTFAVAAASPNPPSDALLKIWIHFVSDRYVERLSEGQPGSLVILAHYAVLLRRSEQYWYLEGVTEQIMNIANALVPLEWGSWLQWPRTQILGGSVGPVLG
ncbi:hypothetical protein EK21DRAFT_97746 [Setomelanomma holmii]|uniref:Uncharacterized protein n=1 Tax=Setomelanomma holmii TaxID=210430 RepID=A0A9P4LRN9_9PLEO|nr:hypothetical protein EK21DRAFT_97746 [Setomelanomma holmii]